MSGRAYQTKINGSAEYNIRYNITGDDLQALQIKKKGKLFDSTLIGDQSPIREALINARDTVDPSEETSALETDITRDLGIIVKTPSNSYAYYKMSDYAKIHGHPLSDRHAALADELKALLYPRLAVLSDEEYMLVELTFPEDPTQGSAVVTEQTLPLEQDDSVRRTFFDSYTQSSGSFLFTVLKKRLLDYSPVMYLPHGCSSSGYYFDTHPMQPDSRSPSSSVKFINVMDIDYLILEDKRVLDVSFKAVSEYHIGPDGKIDPVPFKITATGRNANLAIDLFEPDKTQRNLQLLTMQKSLRLHDARSVHDLIAQALALTAPSEIYTKLNNALTIMKKIATSFSNEEKTGLVLYLKQVAQQLLRLPSSQEVADPLTQFSTCYEKTYRDILDTQLLELDTQFPGIKLTFSKEVMPTPLSTTPFHTALSQKTEEVNENQKTPK